MTDGDVVFQPRKLQCSGLWHGVEDGAADVLEVQFDAFRIAEPGRP